MHISSEIPHSPPTFPMSHTDSTKCCHRRSPNTPPTCGAISTISQSPFSQQQHLCDGDTSVFCNPSTTHRHPSRFFKAFSIIFSTLPTSPITIPSMSSHTSPPPPPCPLSRETLSPSTEIFGRIRHQSRKHHLKQTLPTPPFKRTTAAQYAKLIPSTPQITETDQTRLVRT
ncbi:hypothetical protein BC829DRAFT_278390 [Chytridium lagenaria]|nr:hypothetical protein BC829DRAFT_278390 [Chytridium lagenaria]